MRAGALLEALLEPRRRHAVVRTRGAGKGELNLRQVKLDDTGVARVLVPAEDALLLGVRLDEGNLALVTAGQTQVVEDVAVDREERRGSPVLRGHVGDAGALGHRERGDAGAVGLDKTAHDALGAQALGDGEGEVHRRHAVRKPAHKVQAHDLGHAQADRLPEGRRLGLDAADAPSEHPDAVGRGRVRVGAHDGVEARELTRAVPEGVGRYHAAEALDVELVADALSGRDDLDVVERVARPLEEGEALAVARGLDGEVVGRRAVAARLVGADGVVDDERAGDARVHALGVSPALDHGVAHGREVDEHRHAREVLEQHARGHELDLVTGGADLAGLKHTLGQKRRGLVIGGAPYDVLEQHHEADRELVDAGDAGDVDHLARKPARFERRDAARLGHGLRYACLVHGDSALLHRPLARRRTGQAIRYRRWQARRPGCTRR